MALEISLYISLNMYEKLSFRVSFNQTVHVQVMSTEVEMHL